LLTDNKKRETIRVIVHLLKGLKMTPTKTTAREVKIGDFVQFTDGGPVWIRGAYDRASKKYSFYSADDINKERFVSGNKAVVVGFTY
jgi:hypothetical protein